MHRGLQHACCRCASRVLSKAPSTCSPPAAGTAAAATAAPGASGGRGGMNVSAPSFLPHVFTDEHAAAAAAFREFTGANRERLAGPRGETCRLAAQLEAITEGGWARPFGCLAVRMPLLRRRVACLPPLTATHWYEDAPLCEAAAALQSACEAAAAIYPFNHALATCRSMLLLPSPLSSHISLCKAAALTSCPAEMSTEAGRRGLCACGSPRSLGQVGHRSHCHLARRSRRRRRHGQETQAALPILRVPLCAPSPRAVGQRCLPQARRVCKNLVLGSCNPRGWSLPSLPDILYAHAIQLAARHAAQAGLGEA